MKILVVDDEAPIRDVLSASLRDEGYEVHLAVDGAQALVRLAEIKPEICFLDIWMPGDLDGVQTLSQARQLYPETEFVMISGHGTIETAVKATKLGAWDFIEKPLSMDKILIVIQNIKNYIQERDEKSALLNKLRKSIALVGETSGIVQVKQLIARIAPTPSWLLMTGPSGAGKHLAAQNIHYMSPRASRAFVELNCASIPEDLLESEIFGLEKGAMPGVDKTRRGKIEHCHGGTLYLKEITEMSSAVQAKLLRFMQEKVYQRVGGSEALTADVRVIASSTKDLKEEIEQKKLRQDLYDRLHVVPFYIPSLVERKEDIPALVAHFSDLASRDAGGARKIFSEQAIDVLKKYSWPGNIRELKNFVERVHILTPGDFIDVHDVRFAGLAEENGSLQGQNDLGSFREARAQFEREYLIKKIQEFDGNISKTAEMIGLERSYLHRKIKAYGIEVE